MRLSEILKGNAPQIVENIISLKFASGCLSGECIEIPEWGFIYISFTDNSNPGFTSFDGFLVETDIPGMSNYKAIRRIKSMIKKMESQTVNYE